MRLTRVFFAACCLLSFALPRAAAQDHIELFGGYSFVHASAPVTSTLSGLPCPTSGCPITTTTSTYHPNLNGWEFAGTFKPGSWFFGFTADFSGHYGSVGSSSTHLQTYLFGPTFSFPARVSPFVHFLFGGAHESIGSSSPSPFVFSIPTSGNAFAMALGAGIDIKAAPFVSFRPIQLDYLLTRFNSSTQTQPRVSAGLVFRF